MLMDLKTFLFLAASLPFLASCGGTVDPDKIEEEIPEEFTAPFTLYADKSEVDASGSDYVTFSLKDAYDRDVLLDRKELQNVNITSDGGQRVPRLETKARFIANGTYKFTATYLGEESNPVRIVAKNRAEYEKFHKNVAIYKATATWCNPCALMTKALENINEDTRNHTVELCWHYQDDLAIKLNGSNYDCGTLIASKFGSGGVPTVVLDLQTYVSEQSSSSIETAAWDLRANHPATCGINVSTGLDASQKKLSISAELLSSTGGEYDLGVAVLLNDQIIASGTNDGGKYSSIVCAATGNYMMYSTSIAKVAKDATLSIKKDVSVGDLDTDKLSVAVFALVKEGDGARIDNIVEVKAGKSIDYVYNE